ncbi:hypothetical protein, partial [Desulfovibrio sp.]|uniref:hypothetical protein n=1 Tax=Desulfovibrio sp. TaxID=885 RepID=UPI003AB4573E
MKKFFPPLFLWRNHASFPFSSDAGLQSEPPAKRVVCSGPVRACYRLRLKTLAFTLFKPSALAAL